MAMAYPVQSLDDMFNLGYKTYVDLIAKKENLKLLLSSLNAEITDANKQNTLLSQIEPETKGIKKRIGQKLDEGNTDRLSKLEDRLAYNAYKKSEVEAKIKAEFSEKEESLSNAIGLFDKIILQLGSHIGILQKNTKNGTSQEQLNQEFTQNIEKLNNLLKKFNLPSLDFENLEQFSVSPFNTEFEQFLKSRGVTIDKILEGNVTFRGKPLTDAYGCYGHLPKENILDLNFFKRIQKEMNERGGYVFQVEMPQCIVKDSTPVFDENNLPSTKFIDFLKTIQINKEQIETALDSLISQKPDANRQDVLEYLVKQFPQIKKEFWFDFADKNNPQCSISYVTIDRNFFFPDISSNNVSVLAGGGFRSMISANNREAKEGRVHGNYQTRWAPVTMNS